MLVGGRVGPIVSADNAGPQEFRLERTGALVTQDAHGRYREAASRGNIFAVSTTLLGTTVVAANNSPIAAAAASILSIYNPLNSGINVSILRTILGLVSGTPVAGPYVYNIAFNQNITATQNNGGTSGASSINSYASGASGKARGFTQTALTGSTAQVLYRPIAFSQIAAAIAATTPGLYTTEEVAGEIELPPGGLLSIASPGTGTSQVMYAAFVYEEIPSIGGQ